MNRGVAEAARILGVNGKQVKAWAWLYKEYLGGQANPTKGKSCMFTDSDVCPSRLDFQQHRKFAQSPEFPFATLSTNLKSMEARLFYGRCTALPAVAIHPMSHSSRMSWDGSTASARRAGMAEAAMPSRAIVNTAPPITAGSLGFA